MAIKFFNNIEVDSTVDGVDISTFKSAYDNHNHDGRYYTETEVNNLLAGKAASSHTHTWANISGETTNSINSWGGLRHQTNDGYIDFGPANTSYAHIYTDRPNFYFNKELLVLGSKVWHSGNDGAGTGLDADTVDGQHESVFMRKSANSPLDMNQNDIVDGNTIYMDNWYRSYGTTGWYNQTYGGGIYMTDSTWVRVYNNKKFRVDNAIRCKSSSSGQYALETQYANDVSGGGFYHNTASGMELRLNNTSGIQTIALRGNAGTTHSFINAGNFGIGTTAPSYKTDVINTASNQTTMDSLTFRARSENYAGTVAVFENNSGINTSIRISDTVDDMYVVSRNGIMGLGPSGGWSSSNLNIKSNGFVGIGHRNPSDRLHVKNGSIRAEGSVKFYEGTTNRGFVGPNGSLLTISSTYKTVFKTGATQTEKMRLTDVGNLGVGTIDPDHRVDVNGAVRANNFYTNSDYRLKSNVTPLDNAITRVKQLDAYRFNWNDRLDEPKVDGFIAHEVASVVPEAVSFSRDAVHEDGSPKYQGVDQTKIIPLLTAALQEAIQKIESLETRIQTLENN